MKGHIPGISPNTREVIDGLKLLESQSVPQKSPAKRNMLSITSHPKLHEWKQGKHIH